MPKGSKAWIQIYANCQKFRNNCNIEFYEWKYTTNIWKLKKCKEEPYDYKNINFLSPLLNDPNGKFHEYEINSHKLYSYINKFFSKFPKPEDFDYDANNPFWTKNGKGMIWDALAIDLKQIANEFYIFEAKAHVNELLKKEINKNIVNIITMNRYFHLPPFPHKYFYQIINRLCMLYRLKELEGTFLSAKPKLIFLNFYNDYSYEKSNLNDFKHAYEIAWNTLVPNLNNPYEDVYVAFVNVEEESKNKFDSKEHATSITYKQNKCDYCPIKNDCDFYKELLTYK